MALAVIDTELEVAKLAAEYLGEDPDGVADITTPGSSAVEEIFNRHYLPSLYALTRGHRWNWAIERTELVEDGTAPNFGYSSRFAVPSDALRLLEINGVEAATSDQTWRLESGFVLLNTNVAKCVYLKEPAVADYQTDPLFVKAFGLYLAVETCVAITQSYEKKRILEAEFSGLVLPPAIGIDAREDRPRVIPRAQNSRWLAARRTGVLYTSDLIPAVASEQWLELTDDIPDGSNSVVVSYVDAAGGAVTMPTEPELDDIILTSQFNDGGSVTSVTVGLIETNQITINAGATNHGGINLGLRIKRNT